MGAAAAPRARRLEARREGAPPDAHEGPPGFLGPFADLRFDVAVFFTPSRTRNLSSPA
jgi:hypothetical protein